MAAIRRPTALFAPAGPSPAMAGDQRDTSPGSIIFGRELATGYLVSTTCMRSMLSGGLPQMRLSIRRCRGGRSSRDERVRGVTLANHPPRPMNISFSIGREWAAVGGQLEGRRGAAFW